MCVCVCVCVSSGGTCTSALAVVRSCGGLVCGVDSVLQRLEHSCMHKVETPRSSVCVSK